MTLESFEGSSERQTKKNQRKGVFRCRDRRHWTGIRPSDAIEFNVPKLRVENVKAEKPMLGLASRGGSSTAVLKGLNT